MCVEWTNDWEITQQPITAYKVVRRIAGKKSFSSPTKISSRADQGYSNRGSVLNYSTGKKYTVKEPGIYCTTEPMRLAEDDMALLEVRIPKGTRIRRGRAGVPDENDNLFEMKTINAEVVKVIGEYKGKSKKFGWPKGNAPIAPYAVDNYVWSYCTTTTTSYIYVTTG